MTRRSWRNQDRLFAALFPKPKPPVPAAPTDPTPIPFLSPRTRRMLERDRIREAHRAAVKRALEGGKP